MGNTMSCFERYGRQPGGPLVARRTSAMPPAPMPEPDQSILSSDKSDATAHRAARRRPSITPAQMASVSRKSDDEEDSDNAGPDVESEEDISTAAVYAEKLKKYRSTLAKRAKLSKGGLPQTVNLTLSSNGRHIDWTIEGKPHKASNSFPVVAVYRSQVSRKNEAQLEVTVDRGKMVVYTITFASGLQCQEWDAALHAVKQVWSMV